MNIRAFFLVLFFVVPFFSACRTVEETGVIGLDTAVLQLGCRESCDTFARPWTMLRLSPYLWESAETSLQGLSLNLGYNTFDNVNGLTLAGCNSGGMYGQKWSNGLEIALVMNADVNMNGLQLALCNFRTHGTGLSIGAVNDFPLMQGGSRMKGVQIGLWNMILSSPALMQIGVCNKADETDDATNTVCQIGAVNTCASGRLFSIGLVNLCRVKERDNALIQIGLWNDNGRFVLPLINLNW